MSSLNIKLSSMSFGEFSIEQVDFTIDMPVDEALAIIKTYPSLVDAIVKMALASSSTTSKTKEKEDDNEAYLYQAA